MFQKLIIYSSFFIVLMFSFCAVEGMEDKHSLSRNNTGKQTERPKNRKPSITSLVRATWGIERNNLVTPQTNIEINGMLRSQKAHLKALKEALENAKERVIISSPSVSKTFVGGDFIDFIKACKENVTITIFTSPKGGTTLEKALENHSRTIPVQCLPMNHCGIYCLMMDSTLFANGAFPWLFPKKNAKEMYLTSVIRGLEAQRFINLCTHDLKRAFKRERDNSLVALAYTQKQEIPEDMYPRPLTTEADASKNQGDLSWLPRTTANE